MEATGGAAFVAWRALSLLIIGLMIDWSDDAGHHIFADPHGVLI